MKKIYITLAVLSLTAIMNTACDNREEEIGGKNELGSDAIAFSLSGVTTRAEVSDYEASEEVNIIPLGTDDNNNNFFLEETVVDLEAPVTRGTPAYTKNVRNLYGNSIKTYAPAIQTEEFEVTYNEDKNRYVKSFGREIWPEGDGSSLEFYMQMPSSPKNVNILERSAGQIAFSYSSPLTAKEQEDILFTYRNISKTDYDAKGYADVLFHHALTGVKFASKNSEADAVIIEEVKFTGLYDSGNCFVKPTDENGNYVDITDNHSSAADGVVTWKDVDKSGEAISSGEFPTTLVTFPNGAGSFTDGKGNYPESFSKAGNENNLNDGAATQTFWLIPQTMSADVKLEIKYSVNGTPGTWTIDFGKTLAAKNVVWKAGQLRTYTIKVDDVNVKIEDNVTVAGTASDGFTESSKTDVVITNTGNTDAYIRAAIIGQWLDEEGNPVFGFTDMVNGELQLKTVDSWYEDQFVNKNREQGTFAGLAGYDQDNIYNKWEYNPLDGYYYYTEPVPAGEPVPNNLFTSYTVGTAPNAQIAGLNKQIYFVLEIATQAISAKKLNTESYATWREAWANANAQ